VSNEIARISGWIGHEILANTAITDIVGDNVMPGSLDEGTAIGVIYIYAGGTANLQLGRRRQRVSVIYDIKCRVEGASSADQVTVADALDEMFSNFQNRAHNGYLFSSWLVEPLIENRTDPDTHKRFTSLGGTYRIAASPA
jgi:hypothetical protein